MKYYITQTETGLVIRSQTPFAIPLHELGNMKSVFGQYLSQHNIAYKPIIVCVSDLGQLHNIYISLYAEIPGINEHAYADRYEWSELDITTMLTTKQKNNE